MEALLIALRAIRPWQLAVVLVLVLGTAGAVYIGYTYVTKPATEVLGVDQQLIPVQRGDLVNDVSVNGSLVYAILESLRFTTQGTVEDLVVEEGHRVEEGQVLARLDAETEARLEKAVAQARIDLRNAEEALQEAKDPNSTLALAKAGAEVASARLSLRNAQESLDQLLNPTAQEVAKAEAAEANARLAVADADLALDRLLKPTDLDVAQAHAAVASAKLAVRSAEEALDVLLKPPAQARAQTRAAVANASSTLRDAETALVEMKKPSAVDIAQAESVVVSAGLAVEAAQAALDSLRTGPTDHEIADARLLVDSAATVLANAHADLKLTRKDQDQRTEAAQEAVSSAEQSYGDILNKWFGVEVGEHPMTSPEALLDSWGADLTAIFDRRAQEKRLDAFLRESLGDDPDTAWDDFVVYTWLAFFPGDIVAVCEDGILSAQSLCVGKEMDDTWEILQIARDNLDTAQTQGAKAIAGAESAVSTSEQALVAREEALDELKVPAEPLDVDSKASNLAVAQAKLDQAREELAVLRDGPDPMDLDVQQQRVDLARANLEVAKEDLAELEDGADSLEVASQRDQVSLRKASLQKAEDDLAGLPFGADSLEVQVQRRQLALAKANHQAAIGDLAVLTNGADPLEVEAEETQVALTRGSLLESEETLAGLSTVDDLDIALKEVTLAASRSALDAALEDRKGATIRAPWAGIVTSIQVEEGQQVNPNTAVIEIVDPAVIRIDGIVDEIDILFIRRGARASVTMDALPGQALTGSVSEIAVDPTTQQGVVSYPIGIELQTPPGLELPAGLSAVATVVIREDLDVLMVPIDALFGTFEQPVVRVMRDGQLEERAVVLGNNDDYWAIVEDGVAEAEFVVLNTERATTGGSGFGALRGLFGRPGGFGGGQRPGGGRGGGGGG